MKLILWVVALAPFALVGVGYWKMWRTRRIRLAQFPSSEPRLTTSQRLRLWWDRNWPVIAVIAMWMFSAWALSNNS